MSLKQAVWIGLFIGSTIGGSVPLLWNPDILSASAIFGSVIGGALGIWAAYSLGKQYLD
jgi:hypothetical protein